MMIITDTVFKAGDAKLTEIVKAEYDHCTFSGLDLSDSDFSGYKFVDCTFNDCNLSLVKTFKTGLCNVRFVNCKLLGWRFEQCNPFALEVVFERCLLQHATFYKLSLKKTLFRNCVLHETDFSDSDFSEADFSGSDLAGSVFDNTKLDKADFRSAFNYVINPVTNRIRKARFSSTGLKGLVEAFDIRVED